MSKNEQRMSETDVPDEKSSKAAPTKKTLTLNKRPGETNVVRQSFSQGRSKQVLVEVQKKRRFTADGKPASVQPSSVPTPPSVAAPAPETQKLNLSPRTGASASRAQAQAPSRQSSPRSGMVLRELSDVEKEQRAHILAEAKLREAEERRRVEEDSLRRGQMENQLRKDREAAEARRAQEEERHRRDDDVKRRSEAEARRRLGEPAGDPAAAALILPGARKINVLSDDDEGPRRPGAIKRPARPGAVKADKRDGERRTGRLTVTRALDDGDERARSIASFRRRVEREKRRALGDQPREKITREVILPETISIQELANRMTERGVDVIRLLMKQGAMHKITDVIDADTAQLVAEEMGHTVKRVAESDVEGGLFLHQEEEVNLKPRPPVVTIMGHVDHGKTSLLDALRTTNVVAGEAGGITQHIGAYQITAPQGSKITFIDTPGHAAFTAMRARGAKVTDLVVLVVAADDGVMPQTVEAISHAKEAKVPMIVAINKIDKPEANPMRIKTELLQHNVQVESMGGETLEIEISAKQRTNLDKLLEAIHLQAELLDLKANPDRMAEGYVIEAKLDRGRGPVATSIVQRGTLKVGDIVVAGSAWGKVRALVNDLGDSVKDAPPSMPVEVLGFNGVPEAGDRLAVVENEARAREIADYRERKKREKMQARLSGSKTSLADMMSQIKTAGKKELLLVVKGDVQGSVEAIEGALEKLGTEEVGARIIHSGVGGITESDVTLANASKAVIIGFNVRASREAREIAERDGLEIRYYNIIYNLVDDVKAAMGGLLSPEYREDMLGNAQVLEVFDVSKLGKIAGCRVTEGKVERGAGVRLIRDNVVIHEGKLATLRRFKDDVREVAVGQECGMSFENYQDIRVGDVVECYRVTEVQRTL
jgi:translation initiation factor IF-2